MYARAMNHVPLRQELILPQRARGRLELGFQRDVAGRTRIENFYQQGCLKARLTHPVQPAVCEAVSLNISGGIAGGDALDAGIRLGEQARACVTTQAAERVYRAQEGELARIDTRITVGAGARLEYLPQQTILFDGFALRRRLEIDLIGDAEYVGVESVVFGRQAMGERVRRGMLRDCTILRRDGVLLVQEMTRLDGDISALLARRALGNGAVAVASVICVAADAAMLLSALRDALAGHDAGATWSDGVLRARILAPDAACLQKCVVAALDICRRGAPLPRSWQN